VGDLDTQRLGQIDSRRPHITCSITNQHLVHVVRAAVDRDTAVVDLHLLIGLQIVEHHHTAAAAKERSTHLDRRQPVHVYMSDQGAVEEHRHIRDVLGLAWQVREPGRRDRDRTLRQHEVHDRQIMNGEIPQDVDVVLEQPEVDANRVVVIDLA